MSSPTAATSDDFENPWESAANDSMYTAATSHSNSETPERSVNASTSNSNTTSSRRRWHEAWSQDVATTTTNANTNNPAERVPSCAFRCFQACHWLDMTLGAALLSFVLWRELEQNKDDGLYLGGTLSSIWILRGALALITQCGAQISSLLSLGLAAFYGLAAVAGEVWYLIHPSATANSHTFGPIFGIRPLYLLILAALEFVRYFWIHRWIQDELQNESTQDHDSLEHTHSPWWWSSASPSSARQPLLPNSASAPHWSSTDATRYHVRDGITSPTNSRRSSGWWPFRRTNDDDRDDGSVEYASLNEDWASRSQEDPFWWTHEENATSTNNNNSSS